MRRLLLCCLAAACASPPPTQVTTAPTQVVASPAEGPVVASPSDAGAGPVDVAPTPVGDLSASADAATAEPPPLPAGTVVLLVGSSTAGALGPDLKRELEARGITCIVKGKDASYIPEWASEKMQLRKFIAHYRPDLVLVSLGGNEVGIPDPSSRVNGIRRIVQIIGDRPCLWIGTPRWKALRHNNILEVIRDSCAPCRFVDTDEIVPNMKTWRDGVHPALAERRRWAKVLIQWLQQNRDPKGAAPWAFKETLGFVPDEQGATQQ